METTDFLLTTNGGEMSDYLDEIHTACDGILNASYFLQKLSNAFVMTGNEKVGDDLLYLSAELSDCQRSIRDSIGKDLNDRVKRSQEENAKILGMCLERAMRPHDNGIVINDDKED